MFSRSLPTMARVAPPFSLFYKSMSGTLASAPAPKRMQVASALWRRTSPTYGILYSTPRVAAAKQIFKKEGNRLVKAAGPAKVAPRHATAVSKKKKSAKRPRAAPKSAAAAKKKTTTKKSKTAQRSTRRTTRVKAAKKPVKKAVTPYASFTAKVLKGARLAPTAANKNRVFRMWLMTGQQRSLSESKRVSMAVRLLTKNQTSKRKLSKKVTRKAAAKKAKRATAARKPRRAAAAKKAKTAKKATSGKTAKKKAAQQRRRLAATKKAAARRRRQSAAKSKARKAAAKSKAAAKAKARKAAARAKARKAAAKAKAATKLKVRKAETKAKAQKAAVAKAKAKKVATKAKSHKAAAAKTTAKARSRSENPYIEFYRRVRMTGLLPNGRKVVGSRKIKSLWAGTHDLPNIDARVAQATKILEAQTGRKATVSVPAATAQAHNTSLASPMKDITVPENYAADPFAATYVALLPKLKDIPTSTRMAHVAKAWTNSERKDDHRSAKERIAAVAQQLQK